MEPLNFTNVYDFEKVLIGRESEFLQWTQENWHLSIYVAIAYVALVFLGSGYMKARPPFKLRPLLATWSGILAAFSILGAYRALPDLVYTWQRYSFHHTVCHPGYYYGVTGFWSVCFVLSKAYELGDTAFIVLRKQPLVFLHWYHHITVMVFVFQSYSEHSAPGRWFFAMNFTVHAFMYSYYTLRALQIQPPKWTSIAITSMQIAQMIIGCLVFVYVYYAKYAGLACQSTDFNALSGSLMYLSYLVLFCHFFYNSYLKPGRRSQSSKQTPPESASRASDVTSVLKSVADLERKGYVTKKDN